MENAVPNLEAKAALLRRLLAEMGRVVVAFSGGVDSSLLLAVSVDVLGADGVIAVTAASPLLPSRDVARAREQAASLGVEHRVMSVDDLGDPHVRENAPRRCYYCKHGRFEAILASLPEGEGWSLIQGENADDGDDYRPGSLAAQELGVRSPMAEAGLTKADIRELSRALHLPTANLPSGACLATRFPYGVTLTPQALERVDRAETMLAELLGPVQLRVRDHGSVARIEVEERLMTSIASDPLRGEVVSRLATLGYDYVALDLGGYRMGAMNAQLGE